MMKSAERQDGREKNAWEGKQRLRGVVGAVRVAEEGTKEAYAWAVRQREPVFVPATVYADDRGWSILNQLQGVLSPKGQINYSLVYPGVIKAWHRHRRQTDFWLVVQGQIKAGIYRENDGKGWLTVLGEKRPGVLIIPAGLWHGLTSLGNEAAGMVYYVSRAYDPRRPDEERRPFDWVEGFPWSVRHG